VQVTTRDGVGLHVYRWHEEAQAGRLLMVHGYGEHGGRYRPLADRLAEAGLETVAVDLRGHGHSAGARGHVVAFEDYLADLDAAFDAVRGIDDRPLFLVGHSMGALVCLDWLIQSPRGGIRGLVLSSPFLGLSLPVPRWKRAVARGLSRFLPSFAMESGLSGGSVTRDPDMAKAYDEDPLANRRATARWFTESQAAIRRVRSRGGSIHLPILLLYAGADKVACADDTANFARTLGSEDRTVERLDGQYHEILNELPECRRRSMDQIASWLKAHLAPRA
jgi:alpha-beta hydrolase superfamily lysophospholipase